MPLALVGELNRIELWHYQFAQTQAARDYLLWFAHHGPPPDGRLTQSDIDWILGQEGGETTVLRRVPASGGTPESWHIKGGQLITLAELFNFGCRSLSCHFLYWLFCMQPVFLTKRSHSYSRTPNAEERRNAKTLRFLERGTRGSRW